MATTYTLANAVTEICQKNKDYDERRYGANDSKSYFRAKKLFWEAVNMLIAPTEDMKVLYPQFYTYAIGLNPEEYFGYLTEAAVAFSSGKITLTSQTNYMKLIDWYNYKTTDGLAKKIRKVSIDKFNGMANNEVYAANTVYISQSGNLLKILPTDETGKITLLYVKTPDNQLATATSLLSVFTYGFITKAVQLASLLLKQEIDNVGN